MFLATVRNKSKYHTYFVRRSRTKAVDLSQSNRTSTVCVFILPCPPNPCKEKWPSACQTPKKEIAVPKSCPTNAPNALSPLLHFKNLISREENRRSRSGGSDGNKDLKKNCDLMGLSHGRQQSCPGGEQFLYGYGRNLRIIHNTAAYFANSTLFSSNSWFNHNNATTSHKSSQFPTPR